VSRARTVLAALAPFVLHGLAREVDRALGLVLRSELEPRGLMVEIARAMGAEGAGAIQRVAAWIVGGAAIWVALGFWRARSEGGTWGELLGREGGVFAPLYVRPTLTFVALAAVALRPTYPYGFTLPVALTQDWAIGQDAAALGTILALRLPAPRMPAPRAGAVFLMSFLAYALLTPDSALRWEGHPGNEPKYLRQAVAIGQGLTFGAEGVSAAMERLQPKPLIEEVPRAAAAVGRESWQMAGALVQGDVGRDAVRATRITRQTIRGKDGGVYYVLAPGPSLVLAPTLLIDRAINRARGAAGRVVVSVLAWNALAALLVAVLFLLVRDMTGRPGLAAALALGFALLPPFIFYSFQFYPEMLGALVLGVAFRVLVLKPEGTRRHPWLFGWLLAVLPWLHQKFLPVWLVLVVTACLVGCNRPGRHLSLGWAVRLLVPQLVSLYLIALYNFAITGSVRPDALFLAWGPGGVTTARMGQGLLGLLLDARYGIVPYVPVFLLAAAGLVLGGARRFVLVLPAAAVYYVTVASADNWAGAVCNLGRYVMPLAPLAVVLVGMAIARVANRRAAVALVLMLVAWSALFAFALREDPLAANDSGLLLAKSAYGDGNRYLPNLFIRRWSDGAPGLGARAVAWLGLFALGAWWLHRVAQPRAREMSGASGRRPPGTSPTLTLAGVAILVLALGLALERWPGARTTPSFPGAMKVGSDAIAFLRGAVQVREDEAILGPGTVGVLVRAPASVTSLHATVGGVGLVRARGLPPLVLRPTGGLVDVPLVPYHEVRGRDGRTAAFSRVTLDVEGQAVLRIGDRPVTPLAAVGPPLGSDTTSSEPGGGMEPGGAPLR